MIENIRSRLDSIKKQWSDIRMTVFAVEAQVSDGIVYLSGETLTADQSQAAEAAVHAAAPGAQIVNKVTVLSGSHAQWAIVKRNLSNLRRAPSNGSELLAQGLFGEAVELLKHHEDGWWFARLSDGYLGWLADSSLYVCNQAVAQAYRANANALVLAELAPVYDGPDEAQARLGKLPFGAPVQVHERQAGMMCLEWPGESPRWIAERDVLPMPQRPKPDAAGIARTLGLMRRSIGVPYLWGGETPFGYDCSGFAQTALEFVGVPMLRDADMQFAAGNPVSGAPQPGDLLFFSSKTEDDPEIDRFASITHVAVSLGGTEFIHSTGAVWGVTRNSFDPQSPIYRAWLKEHLAGVRRFI